MRKLNYDMGDLKEKYGRLKPIKIIYRYMSGKNKRHVLCICDCGKETVV